VVKPADFARALDADSVARTAYHHLSCNSRRQHVLAIESAKAETRVRRIEKALAMLRDQESAGAPCGPRQALSNGVLLDS
jgi:uncharacterized protein YdeI (YjbR/CyaY-like superfamily)